VKYRSAFAFLYLYPDPASEFFMRNPPQKLRLLVLLMTKQNVLSEVVLQLHNVRTARMFVIFMSRTESQLVTLVTEQQHFREMILFCPYVAK
jgi:hypothetical protein